ncbi:MAG: glycosyltransferase [Gaiellales bacterium]
MPSSSARPKLLLTAYPPDGGVARHVVDLVTGLDPETWEVDLACLPDSEPGSLLAEWPNVTIHHLRGTHGRPSPVDLRDLPLFSKLVARADVVHAHSAKAGFVVRLAAAARGARRRTLYTPHAWSFWAATGAEARLYLGLERAAARWCRAIVAVSEADRAAGVEAGIGVLSQYRVIVNGIDVDRFAVPRRPVAGRILWVGRLAKPKRPDVVIRALALLARHRPEARCDLVGDGPLRPSVERQAVADDLGGVVRLLGARDDVPALLSRAACFLLTSDYEGCPLTVIEAMAAGVPVVAAAVGGVPELVVHGETGLLVEPDRPDLVASALSELLADPAKAEALGLAGRRRARALFSRERMVAATAALYREIVSR